MHGGPHGAARFLPGGPLGQGLMPWNYRVPRPQPPARPPIPPFDPLGLLSNDPLGLLDRLSSVGNPADTDEGSGGRIDALAEQAGANPRAMRFDMPLAVSLGLGMLPGMGLGTSLARGLSMAFGPAGVVGGPVRAVPGTPMFDQLVNATREAEQMSEALQGSPAWDALHATAAPQTRTALGPSLSDGGDRERMERAVERDLGRGAIEAGTGFRSRTSDSGSGDESRDRDGGRSSDSTTGGGGGFGCFAAGTPVLMADGTEKPIEAVQEGEMVMAFPEADPETGNLYPAKVLKTHIHENCPTLDLDVYDLGVIRTTSAHRFAVANDAALWTPAGDLAAGCALIRASGGTSVILRTNAGPRGTVYNLTVEGLHTYVANGLRVHNIKHKGGLIRESRVPGKTAADVGETLQEGEYVMSREAVKMFGPAFFERLNRMAKK